MNFTKILPQGLGKPTHPHPPAALASKKRLPQISAPRQVATQGMSAVYSTARSWSQCGAQQSWPDPPFDFMQGLLFLLDLAGRALPPLVKRVPPEGHSQSTHRPGPSRSRGAWSPLGTHRGRRGVKGVSRKKQT